MTSNPEKNLKLEQFCRTMHGKTVTVVGIGISNRPVVDFLLSIGCRVSARDKKSAEELGESAVQLREMGVELHLGADYLEQIDEEYIFKAPGLRYDLPQLQQAVARGSVLTSEMQVFLALCPAPVFAVTGSDGKTTTTTLCYQMLREEFRKTRPQAQVFVGGNIGKPLLPQIAQISSRDAVVLELSSFQLHTMPCAPHRAAITNLSPNHLNWHTDMEEYIAAKCNIFQNQQADDRLILNYDNDVTRRIGEQSGKNNIIWFSRTQSPKPVSAPVVTLCGDTITLCHPSGEKEALLSTADILLPGNHNVENYMTAIAMTMDAVSAQTVRTVAKTFSGVEHRCELVREKDGVKYYNSSIDSSPTRTIAAVSAFAPEQKLVVILGGYDKHIPFDPLGEPLAAHARAVVLTGATAPKIADALSRCPAFVQANIPTVTEPDFHAAVDRAAALAQCGDAVLLSPACASFDAFPNFEVRGNTFKAHVQKL